MFNLKTSVAALVATLLFATGVSAASLAVAWDPNTEPEVAGYVVSIGTTPGGSDQTIDVGTQTSWTLPSAIPGKTYYFRVQAYTAAGVKSLPSNEVAGAAPLPTALPPFGSFDTPSDNTAGLTGSVAVTGWALDDNGVTKVRILRAPVAGEPAGLVYIGDATLVPGARPDIASQFPTAAGRDRAGWGYLMLTNFLPNVGNGTFTLYAYADDGDGHSTLLGTKTISCVNASAVTPFGAIDTPAQGQTVSGVVNNFGWVLGPGSRRADPNGGGTVQVVIDGVPVGSPTGWTTRADLAGYFPAAQYAGINTALGVFSFDTRTLTDGVHTIAWAVTDSQGGTAGVGSRYFTVANGSASTAAASAASTDTAAAASTASAPSAATTARVTAPLVGRRGFDLSSPMRTWRANRSGVFVVQAEELDRIELNTEATSAVVLAATGPAPLPAGAALDANGVFTWQPGVAFLGTYNLVFSGANGDRQVRIVLNPKGSGRVGPQVAVDAPSRSADGVTLAAGQAFTVSGWAADLDDQWGTGVEAVHVWASPRDGSSPVFLGQATLGGARSDVAAVYGDRFKMSGYGLAAAGLAAGDYDLAIFAWSTVLQDFAPATTVPVHVQ